MENKIQVVRYFRKNRRKDVAIYVRGNNEAMQEIVCKLYAVDKDYSVRYTTRHLEDVNFCDIVLVADPSRISRNRMEYTKIIKDLKAKGIEVESVAKENSDIHDIFSA